VSAVFGDLGNLPELFAAHVRLALLALGTGTLLSLPLGVFAARHTRLGAPLLGLASVVQTIPGLALLALMVALSASFGFWPALLALIAYSVLPVLRNTVTGIRGVDPDVLEAATALGMTPKQRLRRVELPLSAPTIVAGIRTSAVWVVGTATLSTPVGQPSLGNLIFSGLQTRNFGAVLLGCVSSALLAIFLDAVLGATERSLARRAYGRAGVVGVAGILVLASVAVARTSAPDSAHPTRAAASTSEPAPGSPGGPVRVGAKAFTEQYVLAAAAARLIERAGLEVERRESLGSTIAFDALKQGQIDLYVDYTGTLWATVLGKTRPLAPWRVLSETCGALSERFQIRCLGALGFENAYALAMRGERARELRIASLDDLARRAPELRFGTDLEFLSRAEWKSLRDTYGLRFASTVPFDPTFMYDAIARGDVDVITAFSSDARIAELGLTVLADPRRALPPYDAVLLLGPSCAGDPALESALSPLIGHVNVELMRSASLLVDRDAGKQTPDQAASFLLSRLPRSSN
jgi:osmoprotectant transport system permease protein